MTTRRRLALAVASTVMAYVALLTLLWVGQERLLFVPTPLAPTHRFALEPDVRERWVERPDGARLNLLHLQRPGADGVVFFLHGNAGNLGSWFVNTALYRSLNVDLVMLDYRGYGKSSGRIESEAQLHADVRAAWDALLPEYAGRRRIVYGRSLGTGLAAQLAAEVQPDLTVLVSPYASMRSLAAEHYPFVPSALLRYPLRTDEAITKIRGPLLIAHGDRDTLIPLAHGERLHALKPDSSFVVVPGAAHDDIHRFPAYLEALGRLMAPSSPASN
jgi:uncharacterized protein